MKIKRYSAMKTAIIKLIGGDKPLCPFCSWHSEHFYYILTTRIALLKNAYKKLLINREIIK